MSSRTISGVLGAIALAAAVYVGTQPIATVPPLAKLLDPARGAWALAAHARHPRESSVIIPALATDVEVSVDDRGVPHIFAKNELDAIRALGYVVARDRLFQLELQTRAAAGTLTELVGDRALDADRESRELGLPWGAARKFAALSPTSDARKAMDAYAEGVNAYIDAMSAAELPLEYRLLNREPQRWEPLHSMLLLARMGYTLAYSDLELTRAAIEARIGVAATAALFPRDAPIQEPIQPNGQRAARIDARPIPRPLPDAAAQRLAKILAALPQLPHRPAQASNNWAVGPRRSASGHALLANDPHLDLSLPSIWYEAHIVVTDSLDAYGVTFPGAPSIVLGLNRNIAWGATNVGADVSDYYIETVDDSTSPTRYRLDGAWKELTRSIEVYRSPSGAVIAQDTLYYTHRGVMNRSGSAWISNRWLVLEPSAEFDVFRSALRATSVASFVQTMNTYDSPAQNFIVADRAGHIGIRSTGKYPLRPGGRGDRVFDGSVSASDWNGWITPPNAPQAVDPAQGFVVSANQQPADPRAFPAYLGFDWGSPWRAMQINKLLRADSAMTPERMRTMQTDPGSARADAFVPLFLAAAQAEMRAGRGDDTLARAATHLGAWDRRYTLENQGALLFENAMTLLARETWDELARDTSGALLAHPWDHVLFALTHDPNSVWWDRTTTPERESRDAMFARALRATYTRLTRERGPASDGGWRWSRVRHANIWHPLRLSALSALNLEVTAGRETINPSFGSGTHGASWRLVAELGDPIRAWGIYPGGQSANPVSQHYRDHVEPWRKGELDSLRIPASPAALSPLHTTSTLRLLTGTH